MSEEERFEYRGDAFRRELITKALRRVIDPEMALDILALGLVYGVEAEGDCVRVRLTMTSAACPVSEFIVDEVRHELEQSLGEGTRAEVELVWDPPWSPERMSASARSAMAWD